MVAKIKFWLLQRSMSITKASSWVMILKSMLPYSLLITRPCFTRIPELSENWNFRLRAMVDQAREGLCYQGEKLNIFVCLTYKRSPVLTHQSFVLRKLSYYYAPPRPHRKWLCYFVPYSHGKLDLRFVHCRAEKCI